MCSINHDLKAVFIHVHKTGGTYISYMLHKYYGFKNYYLRRPDHDKFCMNKKKTNKYLNYENRIHGVLTYYKTSGYINKKMNMTPQKWDSYYKFCFIRNPYDKIVSAWNHVNRFNIPFQNYMKLKNTCNDVEYMHIFLPQVRNIINERGIININYIGKFENLEEDFQTILRNIGIKNIVHDVKKEMNKREHKNFNEYYDQNTLNLVNIILKEDFNMLDYKKIDDIDIFNQKFSNNPLKNDIDELSPDELLNKLSNNDGSNNNQLSPDELLNKLSNNNEYNKISITYVYFEKNNEYKFNFKYFLENAIIDNIDYYIIINGICSLNIPIKNNINVYYRQNIGFDFGAYSHSLKKMEKEYNYYFFINTSVIGPYYNLDDKNINSNKWIDKFIELFNNNVKVVGTTINIYKKNIVGNYDLEKMYKHKGPYSHVQSMFFGITSDYLDYLNSINFFNEDIINNINNFNYIIAFKEIGLSQIALLNGWNINCILANYKNLDYLKINNDINNNSRNGDPYYNKSFFGENIKKEDVIFYKMNRLKKNIII